MWIYMSSEIIQNVAYDNYEDFQTFHYIWGLFNDETDLRVR
jgi:hypothetical protein